MIFYYVFKFIKKINLKHSQSYTYVSIYKITIYYQQLQHSKHDIHNFYICYQILIKILAYKSLIGHSGCINTDTL